MKFLFAGTLAFISQVTFIPALSLLIALAAAVVLDFATGCYKAKKARTARTSEGFRRTVEKAGSYLITIGASSIIVFVSQFKGGEGVQLIAGFLNDALVVFIIYIEVTSIFENLYAISPNSPLSQSFVAPILKLLTFQIKNNPIIAQAEALSAGPVVPTAQKKDERTPVDIGGAEMVGDFDLH